MFHGGISFDLCIEPLNKVSNLFLSSQEDEYSARVGVNLAIVDLLNCLDCLSHVVLGRTIQVEQLYWVHPPMHLHHLCSEEGHLVEETVVETCVDGCRRDHNLQLVCPTLPNLLEKTKDHVCVHASLVAVVDDEDGVVGK